MRSLLLASGILLASAVAGGCTRQHRLGIELTFADASARNAGPQIADYELVVFEAGCPSADAMAHGLDDGLSRLLTQRYVPGMGMPFSLDPGRYGFAALGRSRESCVPLLFGCTLRPVGGGGPIEIVLASVTFTGAACPADTGCIDGRCEGPAPACGGDGCVDGSPCCDGRCVGLSDPLHCGSCDRSCSERMVCRGGDCVEDDPCSPDATELQTDPSNCGECGHICPSGLGCEGGLCRPREPLRTVLLRTDETLLFDMMGEGRLVGFVWVDPLTMEMGMRPRPLAVGRSYALSEVFAEEVLAVPLDPSERPPDEAFLAMGEGLAFAQLVLVRDGDADGVIDIEEIEMPAELGIAQVGLVYSQEQLPRGYQYLPEGTLPGFAAYRVEPGAELIPAAEGDVFDLPVCLTTMDGQPADPACLASLPSPYWAR